MLIYWFKGIMIGLIFGVPIGAVGALTIRRTITYGKTAGFVSGLGCSSADLCYSCISIFGFSIISDFMLKYQNVITIIGGLFIIAMGIGFIRKKQAAVYEKVSGTKLMSFFASSFMIAITNPATIVTFLLAFSIFDIGKINSLYSGVGVVLGILTGTCIWWTLISIIIGSIRSKITEQKLTVINYILGVLVLLFGILVIIKSFYAFQA